MSVDRLLPSPLQKRIIKKKKHTPSCPRGFPPSSKVVPRILLNMGGNQFPDLHWLEIRKIAELGEKPSNPAALSKIAISQIVSGQIIRRSRCPGQTLRCQIVSGQIRRFPNYWYIKRSGLEIKNGDEKLGF